MMGKSRWLAIWGSVITTLILTQLAFAASDSSKPKFRKQSIKVIGEYLVVLKDNIGKLDIVQVADDLAQSHTGKIKHYYKHALKGFAIQLTEKEAIALSNDPRVEYIEENGKVSINGQYNPSWGLDRTDQHDLPLNGYFDNKGYTGVGVHVYTIDTGILTTHQEFGGRASIAADFIGDGYNGSDCNGHGTHVSGTIGGSTYGVAKGVALHSVRVLDCSGIGSYAGVIAGVDWVTANHISPAVANMSLTGGASDTIDTAVNNSISSGVTYVVAAGNGVNGVGVDASNVSPARVAQAITVGATDSTDTRPTFSNFGSALDLFAPGVNITSAWIGSNTATNTISGTSMATPHVTGAAAIYLQTHQTATPNDVRGAITYSATTNKVTNLGTNSPNRLLYIAFNGASPFYRYFNGVDHFYSASFSELGDSSYGYVIESIEGYVISTQAPSTIPLYRFVNGGTHFYTTSYSEGNGWGYEGISGYVYPTQMTNTVPLYRFFNGGTHFYTTTYSEGNGWGYEGIQCYVYPR